MVYKRKVISGIIIFALVGIYLLSYYSRRSSEILPVIHQEDTLTVLVQPVYQEDFVITKDFIGRVEAYQGQSIYPMISGFIQEILVDGGDIVTVGQPLFVLNQDIYRAKVIQAEANVLQAKAEMNKASLYLKRVQHTSSESISENLLDNAQSAYESARAAYLAMLATLEQSQVELGYTVLRSMLDGVIGNLSVSVGDYVSPQTDLGYVLQLSPIKVVFSVPAKDYVNPQFFDGYDVQILLPDGTVYPEQTELLFMDNQFNQATNSAKVYVLVENHQAVLLPDSSVTVRLKKELKNEILIPQTAVHRTEDGNSVYVLRDGIIQNIPITIKGVVQGQYYVQGNIDKHDQLILQSINETDVGKSAHGVLK